MGDGTPDPAVVEWLLDSDPVIRWQVLRDLTAAPADEVAAERGRLPGEGWAADLLARQDSKGGWGGEPDATSWTTSPEWFCLMSLQWLREMGLDPASGAARRATDLVREHVTWQWWDHRPFFDGEVEPCINGRRRSRSAPTSARTCPASSIACWPSRWTTAAGTASRRTARRAARSTRRSTSSRACSSTSARPAARRESRRRASGARSTCSSAACFRRLSTGEVIDPDVQPARVPDRLPLRRPARRSTTSRRVGRRPTRAWTTRSTVVAAKRGADGRWLLETRHRDRLEVEGSEAEGEPSRWITLARPSRPALGRGRRSLTSGPLRARYTRAGPRNHGCSPPRRTPIDRGRRNVRPVSRARTFTPGVAGSPATRRGPQSIQVPGRPAAGLFHAWATARADVIAAARNAARGGA